MQSEPRYFKYAEEQPDGKENQTTNSTSVKSKSE